MKIKENILNIYQYIFPPKEVLRMSRSDFDKKVYITFEEALKEIEIRRKDEVLKGKIEEFLGEIPEPLKPGINAVLFRSIATPQFEVKRFYDIVTGYDVKPLFWEYHDDKFHSGNYCKYTLGRLPIFMGMDKVGDCIIKRKTILDLNYSNGKKIKDLFTLNGESLIDFHHRLFEEIIPGGNKYLFDGSDWLKSSGGVAEKFYENLLSLFLCHGIFFENYLLDENEIDFTNNIFLNAFLNVEKKFGIKPLIVAMTPTEIEGMKFWNSYPHQIENMI